MTLTKDEYLKASAALATGFGPTTDFADPQLGATAQSDGGIPEAAEGLPGQVYAVHQLPNPAVAQAYALPPVQVPEHLILDSDNEERLSVQGPDPLDLLTKDVRDDLGDPALDFTGAVSTQEGALKTLSERTGAGLGVDKTGEDADEAKKETAAERKAREKAEAEAQQQS